MGAVNIYAVTQTGSQNLTRVLGYFTDKNMAEQAVWACYRQVWKEVVPNDFVPDEWLTADTRAKVLELGFDRWSVDDFNSDFPMFSIVKEKLWNQVPASLDRFVFTMEGAA